MTAENKDFFEALSMLEHERGITAEYLIEKIKAAIVIAVKKNYEVEDDHVGHLPGHRLAHRRAVARGGDRQPVGGQVFGQQVAQVGVVIDYQHAGSRAGRHAFSLAPAGLSIGR